MNQWGESEPPAGKDKPNQVAQYAERAGAEYPR